MSARDYFLPQPGVYADMPPEQYHGIHALSAGGLKRLRRSPAHFYGLQLDPNRPPSEPTPAMQRGTLVHCALFEPERLAERYAVKPEGLDGRTKEGKAWKDANAGRALVEASAMAQAQAMAAAVRALPDVAALFDDGAQAEVSAFWVDEATGELCKCRPDLVSPTGGGVILLDGKTCQDASADGFGRAIWNLDYHLQAAWYTDGYEKASGLHVHGFVFGAVEAEWPHVACAYMLGDDVLDAARRENRRLLDLYAECRRAGSWPGYQASAGVQLINLPAWAQRELENA